MVAKSKNSSTATIIAPLSVAKMQNVLFKPAFNEWEQLQRQLRQGHAVKGA